MLPACTYVTFSELLFGGTAEKSMDARHGPVGFRVRGDRETDV